mmetsp:Transcript_20499/g.31053  ORF Transcript_20499/g.31053 Transcript_20499/m.31053 type:complete len:522 (+) Transcript_20499:173-1738(+)
MLLQARKRSAQQRQQHGSEELVSWHPTTTRSEEEDPQQQRQQQTGAATRVNMIIADYEGDTTTLTSSSRRTRRSRRKSFVHQTATLIRIVTIVALALFFVAATNHRLVNWSDSAASHTSGSSSKVNHNDHAKTTATLAKTNHNTAAAAAALVVQKQQKEAEKNQNNNNKASSPAASMIVLNSGHDEGDDPGTTKRLMEPPPPPRWNVTVIIPFCNRVNQLQDAVESVLRQTYPTHQIVIAISSGDKCLKDKSEVHNLFQTSARFKNLYDEIRSISSPAKNSNNTTKQDQLQLLTAPVAAAIPEIKIVLDPGCEVEQQLKCGGPIARGRNTALKAASLYTTHYAMIDDDDIWLPNKNQIQLEAMDKQGFHFSASDAFYSPLRNVRCMDLPNNTMISTTSATNIAQMNFSDTSRYQRWNTGKYRKIIFKKLGLHPRDSDDVLRNVTLKMLEKHNVLIQSSVLIEKSVFQMFNESLIFHQQGREDIELWLRILRSGNVSGILFFPEPLVFYEPTKWQSTCYDKK